MEFYTYAYVVQRGEFTSLLQYIMTSILLVALLVVGVKVMYNRFHSNTSTCILWKSFSEMGGG